MGPQIFWLQALFTKGIFSWPVNLLNHPYWWLTPPPAAKLRLPKTIPAWTPKSKILSVIFEADSLSIMLKLLSFGINTNVFIA
jgi:hypothetical protein